jgi:hypothetical protein
MEYAAATLDIPTPAKHNVLGYDISQLTNPVLLCAMKKLGERYSGNRNECGEWEACDYCNSEYCDL